MIAQPHHRAQTMIVEFPDTRCHGGRRSVKKKAIARARDRLLPACGEPPAPSSDFAELRGQATLTGVGFFDIPHRQGGIAPNAIELRPVLGFADAGCERR